MTDTMTRSFAGHETAVPRRFAEGHVLTAMEAKWLDSARATTLGNAFGNAIRAHTHGHIDAAKAAVAAWEKSGKKGKKPEVPTEPLSHDYALEASGHPSFQAWFDSLEADYDINSVRTRGAGTGKTGADPVTSLARSFAETDLISIITSKGLTPAQFRKVKMEDGRTRFTHLLDEQFARKEADYTARAKEVIEQSAASMAEGESDLDLSL